MIREKGFITINWCEIGYFNVVGFITFSQVMIKHLASSISDHLCLLFFFEGWIFPSHGYKRFHFKIVLIKD